MSVRTSRARRCRGLSLVEAMLSLAITSTLLTAVGGAFVASARGVQANDQFFRASQTARVSVGQLLAEMRQSAAVQVAPTLLGVKTAAGKDKCYQYDATNKKLLLTIVDNNGVSTNYTLASNVTGCSFTGDSTNVTVSLTVTVGKNNVTMGGSVVPRNTVTYQ